MLRGGRTSVNLSIRRASALARYGPMRGAAGALGPMRGAAGALGRRASALARYGLGSGAMPTHSPRAAKSTGPADSDLPRGSRTASMFSLVTSTLLVRATG